MKGTGDRNYKQVVMATLMNLGPGVSYFRTLLTLISHRKERGLAGLLYFPHSQHPEAQNVIDGVEVPQAPLSKRIEQRYAGWCR